jgi:hypothetical protein
MMVPHHVSVRQRPRTDQRAHTENLAERLSSESDVGLGDWNANSDLLDIERQIHVTRQVGLTSSRLDGKVGRMSTPDELEQQHTLTTATARYDDLRMRDAVATMAGGDGAGGPGLSREETLELLALSEVVIRKAGYGRQAMVRSARAAGASWTQIGTALGSSKQAAWEAHNRWIEDQARQHELTGYEGLDPDQANAARGLAGGPDA